MARKLLNINGTNANYPDDAGMGFNGNARTLAFQGTFNGLINIQASYDDGTTFIGLTDSDGSSLNINADSIVNIAIGTGTKIRFNVSGSSGTSDVDVYVA